MISRPVPLAYVVGSWLAFLIHLGQRLRDGPTRHLSSPALYA